MAFTQIKLIIVFIINDETITNTFQTMPPVVSVLPDSAQQAYPHPLLFPPARSNIRLSLETEIALQTLNCSPVTDYRYQGNRISLI
jgi:hypothetical protein